MAYTDLELTSTEDRARAGWDGFGAGLFLSREGVVSDTSDDYPGTLLGGLMGMSGPNARTGSVPSYHLQSAGRFQQFSPGLRDPGEITASVNWLPGLNAQQSFGTFNLLDQVSTSGSVLVAVRVFAPDPDLHMWRFSGFLTQLGPMMYQPGQIMTGQVGWKLNGRPIEVSPVVYQVSGYEAPDAGSTLAVAAANIDAIGDAGTFGWVGGVANTDSVYGGSKIATTVSAVHLNVGSDLSDPTTDSVDDDIAVTLTGPVSVAGGSTTPFLVRVYSPGLFDIWSNQKSNATIASIFLAHDASATSGTPVAQLRDNGNPPFFVAVYGHNDRL